jgi:hypothetical protein
VAYGNETWKQTLKTVTTKDNFTKTLIDRSFGRCLHSGLLLSGCAMRFTARSFGCTLRQALYREL